MNLVYLLPVLAYQYAAVRCSVASRYPMQIKNEFGEPASMPHPGGDYDVHTYCLTQHTAIRAFRNAKPNQRIYCNDNTSYFVLPTGVMPRIAKPDQCAAAQHKLRCGENIQPVYACHTDQNQNTTCRNECEAYKSYVNKLHQKRDEAEKVITYDVHYILHAQPEGPSRKPVTFLYSTATQRDSLLHPGYMIFLEMQDMNQLSVQVQGVDHQAKNRLSCVVQGKGPGIKVAVKGLKVSMDVTSYISETKPQLLSVTCTVYSRQGTQPSIYFFVAPTPQVRLQCKTNHTATDWPKCKPPCWITRKTPVQHEQFIESAGETSITYRCRIPIPVCFPSQRIVVAENRVTCKVPTATKQPDAVIEIEETRKALQAVLKRGGDFEDGEKSATTVSPVKHKVATSSSKDKATKALPTTPEQSPKPLQSAEHVHKSKQKTVKDETAGDDPKDGQWNEIVFFAIGGVGLLTVLMIGLIITVVVTKTRSRMTTARQAGRPGSHPNRPDKRENIGPTDAGKLVQATAATDRRASSGLAAHAAESGPLDKGTNTSESESGKVGRSGSMPGVTDSFHTVRPGSQPITPRTPVDTDDESECYSISGFAT